MVVQVHEQRQSRGSQGSSKTLVAELLLILFVEPLGSPRTPDGTASPKGLFQNVRLPHIELPTYNAADLAPVDSLITHLCETFFVHLGCNYPFLTRDRFMRDLERKYVDPILVDAICAIAARFSTHADLFRLCCEYSANESSTNGTDPAKPDHGKAFARRAMSAIPLTFACPSVAVCQACLLLAYEQFGSNQDSGLWMYLGISTRLAQDLGMQKLEGIAYEGRHGPTPKTAESGKAGKLEEEHREQEQRALRGKYEENDAQWIKEQKMVEKEHIDTFWALFFLDRVISSGTGWPVTLRDKDIEISFLPKGDEDAIVGWPAPFPALIRIIHLYGRVTDLLNNIREVDQVTPDTIKRLAAMESGLTRMLPELLTHRTKLTVP